MPLVRSRSQATAMIRLGRFSTTIFRARVPPVATAMETPQAFPRATRSFILHRPQPLQFSTSPVIRTVHS